MDNICSMRNTNTVYKLYAMLCFQKRLKIVEIQQLVDEALKRKIIRVYCFNKECNSSFDKGVADI